VDDIHPDVRHAIQAALDDMLKHYAVRQTDIQPGQDHDGDPVIHVHTYVDRNEVPVDIQGLLALDDRIWKEVWDLGEERFVHVRHHWDMDQPILPMKRAS
jgi:hypothetical protein